jgi:hypothetical protein
VATFEVLQLASLATVKRQLALGASQLPTLVTDFTDFGTHPVKPRLRDNVNPSVFRHIGAKWRVLQSTGVLKGKVLYVLWVKTVKASRMCEPRWRKVRSFRRQDDHGAAFGGACTTIAICSEPGGSRNAKSERMEINRRDP